MADPSINDLVKKIDNKIIELPIFQRGFVWDAGKVQKYVESLYKGYPTGSFLMWTTIVNQKEVQYLVDGQQRLTSIMWALHSKIPPFYKGRELNYQLRYNPVNEKFGRGSINQTSDNKEYWVNLPEYFSNDQNKYIEYFQQFDELDIIEIIKNLNRLSDIEKYTYHIQELPRDINIKGAVKIFNLINKQGKTLNAGELAFASLSVIWPGFRNKFESFQESIEKTYGFKFSVYFYMRLLAVINGFSAIINDDFHKQSQKKAKEGWEKLEKILPYVLKIFIDNLKFYKVQDFASQNPIYIMSRYLLHQKKYSFKDQKDINRWISWYLRAIQHQRYSGSGGDAKIDIDVKVVDEYRPPEYMSPIDRLITNIKETKGNLDLSPDEVLGANVSISNNVYNLYNVMLRCKSAKDWLRGTTFFPPVKDLSLIEKAQDHHIFPVAKKNEVIAAGQDVYRYDALPNRAIVDAETNKRFGKKLPIEYLPEVANSFPKALEEQYIPLEPKNYQITKFNEFLRNRAHNIANGINEFINSFDEDLDISAFQFDFKNLPIESENMEYKTTFLVHYEDNPDQNRIKGKKDKNVMKSVYKTLCAYANTDGGKLVIGVDDDLELVGIDFDIENGLKKQKNPDDKYLNNITDGINNNVVRENSDDNGVSVPRLITDPETGKRIVFISVDPIRDYPPVTLNTQVYVRESSMNKPIDGQKLTNWTKKRFGIK